MASEAGSGRIIDLGTSVRSNTGGAAIAAGLMIFFGFIFLDEPAGGSGWYSVGASLLFLALRVGGLVMVGVSAWLSLGHLPALAADAAASIVLGAMIALAGGFMLIDGGWWVQSLVILVSGGSFLTSGLRNGRDFLDMWRIETADDQDDEEEDVAVLSASKDSPLVSDLASAKAATQAKPRTRNEPELIDMEPIRRPKSGRASKADQPVELDGLSPGPPPAKGAGPSAGSSESYLAKLARKDKSADQ
ncbi:MAG: hypothetical protein IH987_14615 [Planctomycetes bacterium]|nr:hypothetical protein [Planctomycetota bacterium]